MTVKHMVWLKTPDGVSSAEMESLMEKVRGMKTIPSVIDIVVGKNFKDTGHGYDYGVIMSYADKDAQREYIAHPDHEKLRDEIKAMDVGLMALDFEH
ncbi:hypothetical protein MNBD_ALPHA04-1525 [hydrothermal vent metagenome]|uniref:Stress-response A/B barrel domain-containing protein n=1 Tax=hydrothermal vent metagenome TaxID=652676 RepID=A0A3B0SB08_9ZZZZ